MVNNPRFDTWLKARGSRRALLGAAVRLGAGAAALAALDRSSLKPAGVRAAQPAHTQVLIEDVTERNHDDFARGQARAGAKPGSAGVILPVGGEFLSGHVGLPFDATHLGLHWIAQSASPAALSVAVRTGGTGGWSAWEELTVEATSGDEVFAALLPGQKRRLAQYRVRNTSDDTVELTQMTLTAINTDDGPQLLTATSSVEPDAVTYPVADGTQITVVSRRGWGCDESLRFSGSTERWPEMYVPAKKVVLHHTATANNYADGAAEVRAIYAYHAQTQGWGDIGYQLLVDRHGSIYEGRHGRGEDGNREIASADVVAGHVFGFNYGTTGVAAIGNSSQGNWRNTWGSAGSKGLKALEDAVTFECGRHYIDPSGASDFLKSDGSWHTALAHCPGHGDCVSTQCPGSTLINYLPNLRTNVTARLQGTPPPTFNGGLTNSNSLTFTWTDDSYLYCLEGWRRRPASEDIDYLHGFKHASTQWNDELAWEQDWTPITGTGAAFPDLVAGHYTMHLRRNVSGAGGSYESNQSFWITGTGDGGGTPPEEDAPPVVSIEEPLDGDIVSGSITLRAEASDDEAVTSVEFFVDGTSIGTGIASGSSWSLEWDTSRASDGAHVLRATATDSTQATSHEINVTVSNAATPPAGLHIGDLDGTSDGQGRSWTARVVITVHDSAHAGVSGATVTGTWGGGPSGTASKVTGTGGTCEVQLSGIPKSSSSVSFTVTGVSYSDLPYDSSKNHDPDADSNGVTIVVAKP